MTDKKIRQGKEINMGIAGKAETAPKGPPIQNKKCGCGVKKASVIGKKRK